MPALTESPRVTREESASRAALSEVERVINANDAAWFNTLFSNTSQQALRRLTLYEDPSTGWILLEDKFRQQVAKLTKMARQPMMQ